MSQTANETVEEEIKSGTFYEILGSIYYLDDSISVKNACFFIDFSFITSIYLVDYA